MSKESEQPYTYERVEKIATFLKSQTTVRPVIGLVTGSGLGGISDQLDPDLEIPYKSIPDFPDCTVVGHAGSLVFGSLSGLPAVCMKGRVHVYEGNPSWKCCVPIRVMKLLGVETIILTNAAGGINPNYKVGDFMVIRDHINLASVCGNSPLRGPNDERFGPRFPLLINAYDVDLRKSFLATAKKLELEQYFHEGIYFFTGGPEFEGVAEVNLMKILGADAVGMSTAHEVIVARHCGMKVLAISLITDDVNTVTQHETIVEISKNKSVKLGKLISTFVSELASAES